MEKTEDQALGNPNIYRTGEDNQQRGRSQGCGRRFQRVWPHGCQGKKANHGKVICSSKCCCRPHKIEPENPVDCFLPQTVQRRHLSWGSGEWARVRQKPSFSPGCSVQQSPAIRRFCPWEEGIPKVVGTPLLLPGRGEEEREQSQRGWTFLAPLVCSRKLPNLQRRQSQTGEVPRRRGPANLQSGRETRPGTLCSALLSGQHTFPSLSLALPLGQAACISGPPQAALSRVSFQHSPHHTAPTQPCTALCIHRRNVSSPQ